MKITAIIQARMTSTRLPGKVLLDMQGVPMLARVVERTRQSRRVDQTLVATTVDPDDDAIVARCSERGWPVYRGSRDDMLDRYYQAALAADAQIIVRVTSDCPLIDPEIIDQVIGRLEEAGADYASNVIPRRTFPRGLDVEVFRFAALAIAWRDDKNPGWREHVTPYFYRGPAGFRVMLLESGEPETAQHRWTVDTVEDYELVKRIYATLPAGPFGWRDVLSLVTAHPEWSELNRSIAQKPH